MATTDSITGTSIRTPTTVASAAPEPMPNRLMAAATASSKKFEAPISADGPATQWASPAPAVEQIGEAGVEIDLDQDRHGENGDDRRLRYDLVALEGKEQHQGDQQRRDRNVPGRRREGLQRLLAAARKKRSGG